MLYQRLLRIMVLLVSFLLLTSCGKPSMPAQEYRAVVVDTLKGREGPVDVGLKAMISGLVADLGCSGRTCKSPLRFQNLQQIITLDESLLSEYKGRICARKEFKPPAELEETHKRICAQLEKLLKEMAAIKLTALYALSSLRQYSADAVDPLLEEISNRLERNKQRIVEIIRDLRSIEWLQPALPEF
jgi:hypothetical protein